MLANSAKLHGDLDDLACRHRIPGGCPIRESLPKVFRPELSVQARQAGIEHEAESLQKVALAASILANDNRAGLERQIDIGEISEVRDRYALNTH